MAGRCRAVVVSLTWWFSRPSPEYFANPQREQTPIMEVEVNTNIQVIKQLRADRAWSQEHLAAVAGLSARTIQRVEADGNASRETRMAIAAAFGIELSQLNCVAENAPVNSMIPAVATGVRPPPPPSFAERTLWGVVAVTLIVLAFGYGIGKDLAHRDNVRCTSNAAQCGH